MLLSDQGEPITCSKCGSKNVIRSGMSRDKQRYHCKDCRSYFVPKSFADVKEAMSRHKAAMLLYLAGAQNNELQELFGRSYPKVKSWIEPIKAAVESDEGLQDARRIKNTRIRLIKSPKDIPAKPKKQWVILELDDDLFDGNSILMSED